MKLRLALFLLFLFPSSMALAAISLADKEQIRENIEMLEQSLGKGDTSATINMLSPNASPDLKSEIQDFINDKEIAFSEQINKWQELPTGAVKIEGTFSAAWSGFHMNGFGNYFTFEKVDGRYLILDTDFQRKMNPANIWKLISKILCIFIPFFIVTMGFWVWMLIDCLSKPRKEQMTWVLVIIFLNILGALIYFFVERNKKDA